MWFFDRSCTIYQQLATNSEEYDVIKVLNNVEFEHLKSNVQYYNPKKNVDDSIIKFIYNKHNLMKT